MVHMLACFDLKPGTAVADFRTALARFVSYLQSNDLIVNAGPIGLRERDTRLGSWASSDPEFVVTLTFRDQAQLDDAYEHLMPHVEPAEAFHAAVYSKVSNQSFLFWRDLI